MAMTAGAVVVGANGNVTKSGMAEALYDARLSASLALITEYGGVAPSGESLQRMKKGIAAAATADAGAMVAYLVANAKATILATDQALQRTPNPNNPATDTVGPAATRYIGIV